MGFFDSMKVGLEAVGGFIGDITGAAMAAAPTIIPMLQSTGVIPWVQPTPVATTRGPGPGPLGQARPAALPGGAQTRWPIVPRVNPQLANQPLALPVGFTAGATMNGAPFAPSGVVMPAFQSTQGGFQQALFNLPAIDLPGIDITRQGGAATLAALTSPFFPTMAGARAQAFISPNPVTGKLTWFKPAGKPILWSGDLTACRRVGRIARRARTASRKR